MKLSDSIKYSLTKTIRNKKNIYFIIILIICSLLATGAISFWKTFSTKLESTQQSHTSMRSLIITPKEGSPSEMRKFMSNNLEAIQNMEHISEIMPKKTLVVVDVDKFKTNTRDGEVELIYGSENTLPENIIGERFTSEDSGVAICPINFYPGEMKDYPKGEKDIYINGYDLLNTNFEATVDIYDHIEDKVITTGKYKKNFKVIGLYDPSDTGDYPFNCFVPGKDIEELYTESMKNLRSEEGEAAVVPSLVILVDKYDNLEQVKKQLIDMGFIATYVTQSDKAYQNSIKYISLFIVLIAITSIVLITIFYIKKRNINNSFEAGILKALGYQNNAIIIINVIQVLIMSIISYIMSTSLLLIGVKFINIKFKDYLLFTGYNILLEQYVSPYIISFAIMMLVPSLVAAIFTSTITKKTSSNILKGEES